MQDGENNEPGRVFRPGDQTDTSPPDTQELKPQQEDAAQPSDVSEEPFESQESAQQSEFDEDSMLDYPHIEWTASEFVEHQKSAGWFGLLAAGSIVLAAAIYIVSEDVVSTAVIVILGIVVGIFANQKPRSLAYRIDSNGISIGEKHYDYQSFKSFSVGHEQAMSFISLMSVKRFMPPISIHYSPQDEEKIVQTLSDYLPFEEHKPDIVDRLSKKFRF